MHDYVIVGAGTAGCVLAGRLSEDPGVRVLLLEAGGQRGQSLTHRTVPQAALFERRLDWPQDAGLAYDAAAPIALGSPAAAYDRWAAAGGWSHAQVRPFQRHLGGTRDDPFSLASLPSPHPLAQAFVRSAVETGCPFEANLAKTPPRGGAGLHGATRRRGQPCGVAKAALAHARERPNLTVITGAEVLRIDLRGGRATGVSYTEDGLEWSAEAERAVVLCAGVAGTPQLLMRSGIGPGAHLHMHGVATRHPLPGVGRGLQRPLAVDLAFTADGVPGPPGAPPEASAFLCTCPEGSDLADLHLRFEPVAPGASDERVAARIRCLLRRPQSRGRLRLPPGSGDGNDGGAAPPALDPQFLTDAHGADLDALVKGLRHARRLLRQAPFARYRPAEKWPGEGHATSHELRALIRLHAEADGAAAGTCRMGNSSNAHAVVDERLRVRGLKGLRVADASVLPAGVRGTSALPLALLAERAADEMA